MSTMTTTATPQAWLPTATGDLILQPLATESIILQAIGGPTLAPPQTNSYRVPIVTSDPAVGWVAEGEEIGESELGQDEDHDTYHKVAGLSVITRELAADTNPAVAQQVGLGLARSIAKEIDSAVFGSRAADTRAPRGLEDFNTMNVIATDKWEDLDVFNAAVLNAADEGAKLSAFVTNSLDALTLTTLRKQDGSNEPLLQPDPTQPARFLIAGVPLLISPAVRAGTVWGIPGGKRMDVIIREDVTIETDSSVYFTADKIVVKATARITTLFPHIKAVQKIIASDN